MRVLWLTTLVIAVPVRAVRGECAECEPAQPAVRGSLEIWWMRHTRLVAPSDDCASSATSDEPIVRATLLRCTTAADGTKACSTVAARSAPYLTESSLSFDNLTPGSYTLIVDPPLGKRRSMEAEVVGGNRSVFDVVLSSFEVFGTVTLNGKPVAAQLTFSNGHATSDLSGRYTAVLPSDPLADQIEIQPCGEKRTFTFIPRAGPIQNAVYDIDLRVVTLEVAVVDADHRPVADATVHFSPIKSVRPEGTEVFFHSKEKKTNDKGRAKFDDVPDDFDVSVCASHRTFVAKCSQFDLAKLGDEPAVVQFDRAGTRGHVEGHAGEGFLAAVSPAGKLLEQVHLDSDGTFLFRGLHASPEYFIYVSTTRPLTVLPLPIATPTDFAVQLPSAPARSFSVAVTDMRSQDGFIGVWIGGMYVPLQVLNMNQELRGVDSMIHRGQALEIRDIAATGPISVAFAPADPAAREFVDAFTLPQYAGVKRHQVTGALVTLTQ